MPKLVEHTPDRLNALLRTIRFTLGFHRASGKPLSVNGRPFTNASGGPFALARSRRFDARRGTGEMITAHRYLIGEVHSLCRVNQRPGRVIPGAWPAARFGRADWDESGPDQHLLGRDIVVVGRRPEHAQPVLRRR